MEVSIQISEQDLPLLSAVATRALALMQDHDATNQAIEDLIRQDPALTQRVLHVANSPFYCGRAGTRTIASAVGRLGLRQLRNVIMMAATGELFNADDPHARALWQHALATALASQFLAEELRLDHTEEAFIAGMLHDVGKLIIYRQAGEVYGPLLSAASEDQGRMLVLENQNFTYFNHCTVGGLTIRKWKLADSVADAVRFHHELETRLPDQFDHANLACVVSLANIFANNLGYGHPVCEWAGLGELACAAHVRLSAENARKLADRIQKTLETQLTSLT